MQRQRFHRVRRQRHLEHLALAIHATEHGVGELARADAVARLRQLDRLRDRRVRRHAAHEEQLVGAQSEEVDDVGIEPGEPAAHAKGEHGVEPGATPEHPVHELLRPAAIPRVEHADARVERRVEQLAAAQVRAQIRRHATRLCDRALAQHVHGSGATLLTHARLLRARLSTLRGVIPRKILHRGLGGIVRVPDAADRRDAVSACGA